MSKFENCQDNGQKWKAETVAFLGRACYNGPNQNEEVMTMGLGNSLFNARKKSGLSQEEVAEKLGVSRQTISKWELDETLPDIRQSKKLSTLYHLSLDELIDFDLDVKQIEQVIENTTEQTEQKIDWTKMWGKKYPVLTTYQKVVNIDDYALRLRELLDSLKSRYGFNDLDAMLVLKDILAHVWNSRK